MRIVKPELVAQGVEQLHVGVGVYGMGLAVDGNGEALAHGVQLPEQETPGVINLVLTSLKQGPDQRPQGTCVEEEPRDAQPSREDCCWTLGGRRDRGFFFNSG